MSHRHGDRGEDAYTLMVNENSRIRDGWDGFSPDGFFYSANNSQIIHVTLSYIHWIHIKWSNLADKPPT
jgi:hypothetical protein